MDVRAIFYSLQGEGEYAGYPCIFVRFAGCDLKCFWCDTQYSQKPEDAKYHLTPSALHKKIIDLIAKTGCRLVEFTGGEPLTQNLDDLYELIKTLSDEGVEILVETNGANKLPEKFSDLPLTWVMDIKCPTSKMQDRMCFDNMHLLRDTDVLKFVVATKEDMEYMTQIIRDYEPDCIIHVSHASGYGTERKDVAEYIMKNHPNCVKYQLQLHKIIWPDAEPSKVEV